MMELSSLLAGAGLLPKRTGGSMNKGQLVAALQQALGEDDAQQVSGGSSKAAEHVVCVN